MSEGTILMSVLVLVGIGIVALLLLIIRTALSDEALKEASLIDQLQEKDKRIAELERRVAGIDENAVYRASAVFTDEPGTNLKQ